MHKVDRVKKMKPGQPVERGWTVQGTVTGRVGLRSEPGIRSPLPSASPDLPVVVV